MKKNVRAKLQFAALPCRMGESGQLQVMLLTSRETRRWVIPKGWPIRGLRPTEVAAREAREEAGLSGRIIGKRRVGMFNYHKRMPEGLVLCEVRVFLLWVNRQSKKWPEQAQRETKWFGAADAAALVAEDGLAEIIKAVVTEKRLRRFCPSPLPATTPEHAPPEPVVVPALEVPPAFQGIESRPADPAPLAQALRQRPGHKYSAR